eukprot:scaffold133169_cov18-Tisochrysis_lutea.AAC.1
MAAESESESANLSHVVNSYKSLFTFTAGQNKTYGDSGLKPTTDPVSRYLSLPRSLTAHGRESER